MPYGVAIVGAGIAGCTAARLYGLAGLRVALIEKHRSIDTFKVLCGHLIQGGTRPTLERLGLWDRMVAAGGAVGGTASWTQYGWMVPDEDWPRVICLRREVLDPMLRTFASETPGVDLLMGETVVDLLTDGSSIVGVRTTDADGAEREIRATLVVGADGHLSPVASLAGVAEDVAPNERFAVWAYYRGIPLHTPPHRVWRLDPDCAFVVRTDHDLTLVVAYPTKARLAEFDADRQGALERFITGLPDAPDLSRAERVSKLIGMKDYPCIRRDPAPRPGLALAGDAALTGDPLPAVGCGWAFRAGEWLADATAPALAEGRDAGPGLERYREAYRFVVGHDDVGRRDALGLPMDPGQRAARAAAAHDREVARTVYGFGMRILPASALRDPSFVERVRAVAARLVAEGVMAAPAAR